MTSDALNWIQEDLPWQELLREQDCDPEAIDVQATKVAVGYTGIARRRAQNVQMMWDRCPLNANRRHWRKRVRPARRSILDYLSDEPSAWCQLCQYRTLEDVRYVLG